MKTREKIIEMLNDFNNENYRLWFEADLHIMAEALEKLLSETEPKKPTLSAEEFIEKYKLWVRVIIHDGSTEELAEFLNRFVSYQAVNKGVTNSRISEIEECRECLHFIGSGTGIDTELRETCKKTGDGIKYDNKKGVFIIPDSCPLPYKTITQQQPAMSAGELKQDIYNAIFRNIKSEDVSFKLWNDVQQFAEQQQKGGEG